MLENMGTSKLKMSGSSALSNKDNAGTWWLSFLVNLYIGKVETSRPSLQLTGNSGQATIMQRPGHELVSPPHQCKAFWSKALHQCGGDTNSCLGYKNRSPYCEKIYIGKTKRNLETRVKEHFRNIKMEKEKSAIAAHVWKEKHAVDHKPVLLKQAANKLGKYPYNKKQRS